MPMHAAKCGAIGPMQRFVGIEPEPAHFEKKCPAEAGQCGKAQRWSIN